MAESAETKIGADAIVGVGVGASRRGRTSLMLAVAGAVLALAATTGCATSGSAAPALSSPSAALVAPPTQGTEVEARSVVDLGPERPAYPLVCRARSTTDGTAELYLSWSGAGAKGALRTVAPSGETTTVSVYAERYRDMIIADEPSQRDLVAHAAITRSHNGKQMIRVGSSEAWSACE